MIATNLKHFKQWMLAIARDRKVTCNHNVLCDHMFALMESLHNSTNEIEYYSSQALSVEGAMVMRSFKPDFPCRREYW